MFLSGIESPRLDRQGEMIFRRVFDLPLSVRRFAGNQRVNFAEFQPPTRKNLSEDRLRFVRFGFKEFPASVAKPLFGRKEFLAADLIKW